MAGFVGRLEAGQVLSAAGHFAGPWREFSRATIQPGAELSFQAADAEYAIFVMEGSGEAEIGSRAVPITPGSSLTIGYRAAAVIRAASEPIEVFVTTLNVVA